VNLTYECSSLRSTICGLEILRDIWFGVKNIKQRWWRCTIVPPVNVHQVCIVLFFFKHNVVVLQIFIQYVLPAIPKPNAETNK